MKKVIALALLLVSTASFCMEREDEQKALSELQKRQLAEAKEKEDEQLKKKKLELECCKKAKSCCDKAKTCCSKK